MKKALIGAPILLLLLTACGDKRPENAYAIGTVCAEEEVTDYMPIVHRIGTMTWVQMVPYGSHPEIRCKTVYTTPTPSI